MFTVISTETGKALQEMPKMEKPPKLDYADRQSMSDQQWAYYHENYTIPYDNHLKSLHTIPIAPEYQSHFKLGDVVEDDGFETVYQLGDKGFNHQSELLVAIPAKKKDELSNELKLRDELIKDLEDKRIMSFKADLTDDMYYLSRKQIAEDLMDKYNITKK